MVCVQTFKNHDLLKKSPWSKCPVEKIKTKYNICFYSRPESWITTQEMGAFLSVAKGSAEPPIFLEIHYLGSANKDDSPLVFVGKGVTFDRYVCLYASILITRERRCFPAIYVQQGAAFSLVRKSSNAIPLNLHYTVTCAAFSGNETTSVLQSRN